MRKDKAKQLIEKYQQGIATPTERAAVDAWYNQLAEENLELPLAADLMAEKDLLWERLPKAVPIRKFPIWWKVAAAVTAITLGVWLYYASAPRPLDASPLRAQRGSLNDIKPGKNTATLTLTNGKTIQLSDAKTGVVINEDKFVYNDDTFVIQSDSEGSGSLGTRDDNKVQMLTASTPRGGTYQVVLPDGTRVWLNADSKISFPSRFSGKVRKVLTEGEVYFEVAKHKAMPFLVETRESNGQPGQQVEVLGTHFNIQAYREGNIETTLLEGSVKINGEVVLKPGQQAVFANRKQIYVKAVNTFHAIAWKEGRFSFQNERLESIMNKVSRWYDVEVVFETEALRSIPFGGTVSRFTNVSNVLKKLEMTNEVHFKIEGRRIIVTK